MRITGRCRLNSKEKARENPVDLPIFVCAGNPCVLLALTLNGVNSVKCTILHILPCVLYLL